MATMTAGAGYGRPVQVAHVKCPHGYERIGPGSQGTCGLRQHFDGHDHAAHQHHSFPIRRTPGDPMQSMLQLYTAFGKQNCRSLEKTVNGSVYFQNQPMRRLGIQIGQGKIEKLDEAADFKAFSFFPPPWDWHTAAAPGQSMHCTHLPLPGSSARRCRQRDLCRSVATPQKRRPAG